MELENGGRRVEVEGRYWRTLLAWLLGVLVPPLAVFAPLGFAMDAQCRRQEVDCSWGLEVLVILPLLALCLLTAGPVVVYLLLRRVGDPLARRTGGLALAMVLPAIALARLTGGIALLVVPPLAGRYVALRRARRALRRPDAQAVP